MVPEDKRFYRRGEGITGTVWEKNEPFFAVDYFKVQNHSGKSEENVKSLNRHSCVWVPLNDSKGKVRGVIRCRNKNKFDSAFHASDTFSGFDIAILEVIGQAAVPHIQLLLENVSRARALGKLTHELKTPLVAIRGAAEFMIHTKGVKEFFDYDYPGDIWSWSELMRRLLGNTDLYRYSYKNLPIFPAPTLLLSEVIIPAKKQVTMLLNERGFSSKSIQNDGFREIPRLYIDRNQFQQVVFNLLSNSIKYAYKDPNAFQVYIASGRDKGNYFIQFRDWGPGIKEDFINLVFEEGVRVTETIDKNISGQGLGLWVVQQVIKAHGGTVKITNTKYPLEFSILLPEYLNRYPATFTTERDK
jgi:signal transduction histidine kinase